MSRLLYANFSRLRKNRLFWLGMSFMFLVGTILVLKQYEQLINYGISVKLEATFFSYAIILNIVSAIFCTLFLGIEYGDGTIRNKIIVGHRRIDIYFSNLIAVISASFLFCFSYMLSNIIFGVPLIGFREVGMKTILLLVAGSAVTVIALCSIFTMISLLFQNKALAPVICIVGMLLMFEIISEVERMLEQPKFFYNDVINPNYLEGKIREEFEFVDNLLPVGQGKQYARMKINAIPEMCLYSTGIMIVTSAIGCFIFKKKDIK